MDIFKRASLLALVCVVSALILSLVYHLTADTIEKVKYEEILNIKKGLVPEATRFDGLMTLEGRWPAEGRYSQERMRYDNLETCYDPNGREVGKIVYVIAKGHDGDIRLMAGVSSNGEVTGLKVVSSNETPGLGSKITEPAFINQFIGKNYYTLALKQDNSRGGIDGIAGATLSSRAVVDAVREGVSTVTSRENGYARPNSYGASKVQENENAYNDEIFSKRDLNYRKDFFQKRGAR